MISRLRYDKCQIKLFEWKNPEDNLRKIKYKEI